MVYRSLETRSSTASPSPRGLTGVHTFNSLSLSQRPHWCSYLQNYWVHCNTYSSCLGNFHQATITWLTPRLSFMWTHNLGILRMKSTMQSISGAGNNLKYNSRYPDLFWGPEQWIHHNRWRQRLKWCGLFHFRVSFSIRRAKFILRVFSVYYKHRLCADMSKFLHVPERTRWLTSDRSAIYSVRKEQLRRHNLQTAHLTRQAVYV